MQRDDLRSGMLVEFKDGRYALVVQVNGEHLFQYLNGGWDRVDNVLNPDLVERLYASKRIKKIYAPREYFVSVKWQRNLVEGIKVDLGEVIYDLENEETKEVCSILEQNGIKIQDERGRFLAFEDILKQIASNETLLNQLREGVN